MYRLQVPMVSNRIHMAKWPTMLSKSSASRKADSTLTRNKMLIRNSHKSDLLSKHTNLSCSALHQFDSVSRQASTDVTEHNSIPINPIRAYIPCNSAASQFTVIDTVSHSSPRIPFSSVLFSNSVINFASINTRIFHTSADVTIYTDRQNKTSIKDENLNRENKEDIFGSIAKNEDVIGIPGVRKSISNKKGPRRKLENLNPTAEASNEEITYEIPDFMHRKPGQKMLEPRSLINNIYLTVSNELKNKSYAVKPIFTRHLDKKNMEYWTCLYHVLWPEVMSFSATAKNKQQAAKAAAMKCLSWLNFNRRIKDGMPLIYSSEQIKNILNEPIKVEISSAITEEINQLLESYEEQIKGLLERSENTENKISAEITELEDGSEDILDEDLSPVTKELDLPFDQLTDPLRGIPLLKHRAEILDQRDMEMYHKFKSRRFEAENRLPIMEYRDQILQELEKERVFVVKGEPGCGKSTQLPQFILDHYVQKGKGTECNIIITQPRRISAISLAKRVAEERDENVGETIGYQVRLQSSPPEGPSGGILFCSTGILLRKMQSNPELLGCSHVIVDEAHERDLNTDVLLVLLNRALQKNPNLKVIIMSATINAGLFEKYFNCNTISIPGFTYPVKMHFLDDIMNLGIRGIIPQDMSLPNPMINAEQMANLIQWISKNKRKGAILCFLPGWSEIQKLRRILEDTLSSRSHIILPIHSRLPHTDQVRIFNRAPQGVQKIILATNIAETSITIDDVVYVVDSCAHKEIRLLADSGRSSIDNQWISQGSVNQRKGRAGRVQPGESYHFITKEKYDDLDKFPTPEIMRVELQKAVLDCKTYTTEKAAEFFAQMPEPPKISAVQLAVNELIEMGALDQNENLTPLGKRIALFPLDPRLSKVMVYSAIFQCVSPVLSLATILSSDFEIFQDTLYNKEPIREMKKKFDPVSDHLSLTWLFHQWDIYFNKNYRMAEQFCRDANLQYGKMLLLKEIRRLYGQQLVQSRMIISKDQCDDLNTLANQYAGHDELVRGVLLSGLDRVLKRQVGEFKNGRFRKVNNVLLMQDGHKATLTPESVNYNRSKWPTPYLVYQRHVHSAERRTTLIRDTSLVSPLTVLLFTQGEIKRSNSDKPDAATNDVTLTIEGKQNVNLVCHAETATTLLKLRDSLHNVTKYFVANEGLHHRDQDMSTMRNFKTRLIQVLNTLLIEANKQSNDDISKKNNDELD